MLKVKASEVDRGGDREPLCERGEGMGAGDALGTSEDAFCLPDLMAGLSQNPETPLGSYQGSCTQIPALGLRALGPEIESPSSQTLSFQI